MSNYEFAQLDVFTKRPLEGNQLAIFTDARGMSDEQMQALAREMNLSETTFIVPRDEATEAREGVKVRIFTVAEELPFAGHPTLGTATLLRSRRGSPAQITLDLRVGTLPVTFTDNGTPPAFGEMRQRDPEFRAVLAREEVARAIGIGSDEIADQWPIQIISTGLPYAVVPFRRLETLTNLRFSFAQAADFLARTERGLMFYFICPQREGDKLSVRARMIFYGGEDPATGSAAGCCAAWMVRQEVANSEEQVMISQGEEVRRPSEIFVRAARSGSDVTNVRVGGYAVEVLTGVVRL